MPRTTTLVDCTTSCHSRTRVTNRYVRINDIVLDVTRLVDALGTAGDRIGTVHTVGSDYLTLEYDGSLLRASEPGDLCESEGHAVHRMDVFDERDIAE